MKKGIRLKDDKNKVFIGFILLIAVFILVMSMSLSGVFLKEENMIRKEIITTEGDVAYLIYDDAGHMQGIDLTGNDMVDHHNSDISLWGSTKISDSHIGTALLALDDNGQITFGESQEISMTYNAATKSIEWVGGDIDWGVVDFESIGTLEAEQFISKMRETSVFTDGRNPIVSTEGKDIYVDPVNGDDSNPGTKDEPIRTLREAQYRQPMILFHHYHVILKPGFYENLFRQVPTISTSKPRPESDEWIPFQMRSSTGNREDVEIYHTMQFSMLHGEQDFPNLKDITVHGTILQKFGHIHVDNVLFTGQSEHVLGGRGLDTHAPTIAWLNDCTFEYELDYAAVVSQGAEVTFSNCEGRVRDVAVEVRRDSKATFGGGSRNLWGDNGQFRVINGGRVFRHQYEMRDNPLLFDDFGDAIHDFDQDPSQRIKNTHLYGNRVEWTSWATKPVLRNQQMVMSHGNDMIFGSLPLTRGRYIYDFSFDEVPTSGRVDLEFWRYDSNNYLQVLIESGGGLKLQVIEDGVVNTVIEGTWDRDTFKHRLEIIRDEDGFELIYDGESIGTHSEDFLPFTGDYNRIIYRIVSSSNAEFNLHQLAAIQNNPR